MPVNQVQGRLSAVNHTDEYLRRVADPGSWPDEISRRRTLAHPEEAAAVIKALTENSDFFQPRLSADYRPFDIIAGGFNRGELIALALHLVEQGVSVERVVNLATSARQNYINSGPSTKTEYTVGVFGFESTAAQGGVFRHCIEEINRALAIKNIRALWATNETADPPLPDGGINAMLMHLGQLGTNGNAVDRARDPITNSVSLTTESRFSSVFRTGHNVAAVFGPPDPYNLEILSRLLVSLQLHGEILTPLQHRDHRALPKVFLLDPVIGEKDGKPMTAWGGLEKLLAAMTINGTVNPSDLSGIHFIRDDHTVSYNKGLPKTSENVCLAKPKSVGKLVATSAGRIRSAHQEFGPKPSWKDPVKVRDVFGILVSDQGFREPAISPDDDLAKIVFSEAYRSQIAVELAHRVERDDLTLEQVSLFANKWLRTFHTRNNGYLRPFAVMSLFGSARDHSWDILTDSVVDRIAVLASRYHIGNSNGSGPGAMKMGSLAWRLSDSDHAKVIQSPLGFIEGDREPPNEYRMSGYRIPPGTSLDIRTSFLIRAGNLVEALYAKGGLGTFEEWARQRLGRLLHGKLITPLGYRAIDGSSLPSDLIIDPPVVMGPTPKGMNEEHFKHICTRLFSVLGESKTFYCGLEELVCASFHFSHDWRSANGMTFVRTEDSTKIDENGPRILPNIKLSDPDSVANFVVGEAMDVLRRQWRL